MKSMYSAYREALMERVDSLDRERAVPVMLAACERACRAYQENGLHASYDLTPLRAMLDQMWDAREVESVRLPDEFEVDSFETHLGLMVWCALDLAYHYYSDGTGAVSGVLFSVFDLADAIDDVDDFVAMNGSVDVDGALRCASGPSSIEATRQFEDAADASVSVDRANLVRLLRGRSMSQGVFGGPLPGGCFQ